MAKIKNLIIPSMDNPPEILDHLHIFGGNIKWYSHSGNESGSFLKN